ncbi:MAG: acetamidase/formamidase family protein [Gammaproteobacteria bacterium]
MSITTIHRHQHHLGWDNSNAPCLTVAPGERLALELMDASRGLMTQHATAATIAELDVANANPLTGPVAIDGAEPGDTLVVHIHDYALSDWGWTAIIPGFGLLADDFPDAMLHLSRYDARAVEFAPGIRLPTRPFAGTIGVAPAAPGHHSAIPPLACGGNMDVRSLVAGTTLYLPVQVPGALFSVGDGHAAQGDGELCGTAIETTLGIEVSFDVIKGETIPYPRFRAPAQAWPASGERLVTTGIGPDLYRAAQDAARYLIDRLGREQGMAPELAYCLLSVAANLRIAELVNQPQWTVACEIPLDIFD